ncbi:MAG: response regulator [Bacteriovorax sp.]|nr:response regulator [Bacteriovorax sp.]
MKVLIVDDEINITEVIEFIIQEKWPTSVTTLKASSVVEAINLLKMNEIHLCISDHNMPGECGDKIFNFIIDKKLETKFVLCSTLSPKDMPEVYPYQKIFFNIQKPDIFLGIEKLSTLVSNHEFSKNFKSSSGIKYIPLTINLLGLLEKTPADIYIKLTDHKYVKCINKDVLLTDEDLKKYEDKSVANLYILNSGDHSFESILLPVISKIMFQNDISLSDKISITHSQLSELVKFAGVTPELAIAIKENIEQSVSLIAKIDLLNDFWKKLNLKGEYPSQLYTLHSMLGLAILKKLEWSSEATMFKLSLASFLQDITLNSISLMKIFDYNEFLKLKSTFSDIEIENYLSHPIRAKNLVSSFKEIPPDIDRILLEQHELPDGTGFPRKRNSNQIGPMSCLFILTGILARYILEEGNDFQLSGFLDLMELQGYSKGNFKLVFNALKGLE